MVYTALASLFESKEHKDEKGRRRDGTILARFFNGFINLEDVTYSGHQNPDEYSKMAGRNAMIALLMKSVLPLNNLREIGMMPPANCDWDNWVCCLGPCKGLMNMRGINASIIKLLRWANGSSDPNELRSFDAFINFWCGAPTRKAKGSEDCGKFMSIFLTPVSKLPSELISSLTTKFPSLAGKEQKLFLCVDHFREMIRSKDDDTSARRELFSFCPDAIIKSFENDGLKLSTGNLKSQSLVYFEQISSRRLFETNIPYQFPITKNLTLNGWKKEWESRVNAFVSNISEVWLHMASLLQLEDMTPEDYKRNIITK